MKQITIPPEAFTEGDGQVDCYCEHGGLAITRLPMLRDDTRGWRVTHVRSGLIAVSHVTLPQARAMLTALLSLDGVDWTKESGQLHPGGLRALGEIVYALRDRVLRSIAKAEE